jgi:predicted PhzF superfamily epimerase YddE/YHI9
MKIFQVDAFTDRPFAGNPAGVCLLDGEKPVDWMQSVAAEMNLAETAFVRRTGGTFGLRWFTPKCEVELCGHATLATAHVLWEQGILAAGQNAAFDTMSGRLGAARDGEVIELDFPARPIAAATPPEGMLEALAAGGPPLRPLFCGVDEWNAFFELSSEDEVKRLSPDPRRLALSGCGSALVTARGREFDFVSRFFAPGVGIDEDPVTGVAHCYLAPYWAPRLGRAVLTGRQVSARGGTVRCRLAGDRVFLGGRAVTVIDGNLLA